MVGCRLHLFTKWPRHIFLESLFPPPPPPPPPVIMWYEVRNAATWDGNGEMTYELIFFVECLYAINVYNDCEYSSFQ